MHRHLFELPIRHCVGWDGMGCKGIGLGHIARRSVVVININININKGISSISPSR